MLAKFEVTNFKNFGKKLIFDLTETNMYEFNKECVVDGIVSKGLVYGHNGTGKSNLGFALFDIVSHLTDKQKSSYSYASYLNAFNSDKKNNIAEFRYIFRLEEGTVDYQYGKTDLDSLVYEKIVINDKEYASIDRRESSLIKIDAAGAENLKRDVGDSQISIISYILNNSLLEDTSENNCLKDFVDFVDRMLFFRALMRNDYIGFQQGSSTVGADIVKKGNVEDFQNFLNKAGIKCNLSTIESGDKPDIAFDFGELKIPFHSIASNGTISLELFYYWYQRIREETAVSFLFIDEFDAFYHHSLSILIVELLKKSKAQIILTTHNTSIMSNDLLRPDCYFLLKNNRIKSLSNSTVKELREAHNIEKLYKAGAFCE